MAEHRTIEQRSWGRWNVLWFRVTLPFWRSFYALKRAAVAAHGRVNLVTDDELMAITAPLDEHPEDWHHPCMCAECRSYGDG